MTVNIFLFISWLFLNLHFTNKNIYTKVECVTQFTLPLSWELYSIYSNCGGEGHVGYWTDYGVPGSRLCWFIRNGLTARRRQEAGLSSAITMY